MRVKYVLFLNNAPFYKNNTNILDDLLFEKLNLLDTNEYLLFLCAHKAFEFLTIISAHSYL